LKEDLDLGGPMGGEHHFGLGGEIDLPAILSSFIQTGHFSSLAMATDRFLLLDIVILMGNIC
jgi:hypothetical protein